MVFYAYLDPSSLSTPDSTTDYGMGILRALAQNCVLFGFEDQRTRRSIGEYARNIQDQDIRKKVQGCFSKISSNRLVECLTPDYTETKSDIQCVSEQAGEHSLDALIAANFDSIVESIPDLFVEASRYSTSNFEERRSAAYRTIVLAAGQYSSDDFLNIFFRKALKHATEINILDRLLVERMSDHYKYSLRRLLGLLSAELRDRDKCRIIIHHTTSDRLHYFQSYLNQHSSGLNVELVLHQSLPHDRFIWSNQFSLHIGRGIDFLNSDTDQNNDTTIGHCDPPQI